MARVQKAMCPTCTGRIEIGDSYCDHCGRPTAWASYEERIDWEVRQWRDARSRSGSPERIQPRRRSTVAVAEVDSRQEQPVATAVKEAPTAAEPRESLLARLLRLLSRLSALFNARIDSSASAEPTAADQVADVSGEAVARPTLVVVSQLEVDEPVAYPVEDAPVQVEPEVVPEPVVTAAAAPEPPVAPPATKPAPVPPAPAAPEVTVPAPVASEPTAPEPVAPDAPAPVATAPIAPAMAPAVSAGPTVRRPTTPRKRPNRPTNKELLQRALTTLERVEKRIHHLEEEIEEIDQAVRKSPPPPAAEDDDLEPPPTGFVGYI